MVPLNVGSYQQFVTTIKVAIALPPSLIFKVSAMLSVNEILLVVVPPKRI